MLILLGQAGLVLALPRAAMADFEEGLTEALVILDNDSDQARIAAFPRALDQVFTKLSGRRPARSSPVRESELDKAALLVQRYRYQTSPSGEGKLRLWVRFDTIALAESARRAGVKVWSEPRPAPLLWVTLGSAASADWLTPASEDGLDRVLLDAAWRRGLPLRLPLMDLEDRMRVKRRGVQSADIDMNMLAAASERYPAVGPVVGASVKQGEDGGWMARWLMLNSGELTSWRSGGVSPEQALAAGVDGLADLIAARYVAEPAERAGTKQDDKLRSVSAASETIEIAVRDVGFGGGYGALMDYLRKLEGVSRFSMLPNKGQRVRFRLDVSGGEEGFRDIIARDDVLEPDGSDSQYRMKQ